MQDESVLPGWDPGIAKLIDESQDLQSVRLDDFEKEQVLTVRTSCATFLLVVTNREQQRVVLAATGDFQLEPTEAVFYGSSWGSPMAKLGLLVVGMRLVLTIRGRQLMTPEVLSIQIRKDSVAANDLVGVANFRSSLELWSLGQIGRALWAWIKRGW